MKTLLTAYVMLVALSTPVFAANSGFDSTVSPNVFSVKGQDAITVYEDTSGNNQPTIHMSGPITEGSTTISTDGSTYIASGTNPAPLIVNGKVGIGTATPAAALDVNGAIKTGSATIGSACSPEGLLAYDLTNHTPIYCNGSTWASSTAAASPTITGYSANNGAGTNMGSHAFCALTFVYFWDHANQLTEYCNVFLSGTNWVLQSNKLRGTTAQCNAYCMN